MTDKKLEFEVRAPGSDMRTTVKVDGYNYQAIDKICKQTNITLFVCLQIVCLSLH